MATKSKAVVCHDSKWWFLQVKTDESGKWWTIPRSNERSKSAVRGAFLKKGETMRDYPDYRIVKRYVRESK